METELLVARIKDAIRLCDTSSMPRFVGFLSASEAAAAQTAAERCGLEFEFFGGYEGAERVYFGAYPDWCEDRGAFRPVTAVTLSFRRQDKLAHRDILGALMSLGITRESVGDILIEDGRAVVFLSKDIEKCVLTGLTKAANVGLTVSKGFSGPLPGASAMLDIRDTVASARLDCIVAALTNCSRGQAAVLIDEKLVSVNSVCAGKAVKTVRNGDRITVRGKGKFLIESVDDRTKKDRIILKAKKYI